MKLTSVISETAGGREEAIVNAALRELESLDEKRGGQAVPDNLVIEVVECPKYIPHKGRCMLYNVYDPDTPARYTGGAISLDLEWIRPCSIGDKRMDGRWHRIVCTNLDDLDSYYMISTTRRRGQGLKLEATLMSKNLINAVITYLAEESLLA
jgi:hypothetical protein